MPLTLLRALPWVLALAAAVALAIAGRTRGPLWLHYLGKPAMLPILLAWTFSFPSALPDQAQPWLWAALALAWVGDIALMFGRVGFLLGLASFLLGHLAYLVCFSFEVPWRWPQLAYLAAVLPFAILAMRGVLPRVGRLKPPVLAYAIVLTGVAWRLVTRFDRVEQLGAAAWLLGAVGGGLFVLADSLLVRRRFAGAKVPYWLELGSYAASQACIVASTLSLGR